MKDWPEQEKEGKTYNINFHNLDANEFIERLKKKLKGKKILMGTIVAVDELK